MTYCTKISHELDRCVPTCKAITDPDLQVISGGLGEGLAEPWRVVECAAGAMMSRPSTSMSDGATGGVWLLHPNSVALLKIRH